jgi:hypothetical protein
LVYPQKLARQSIASFGLRALQMSDSNSMLPSSKKMIGYRSVELDNGGVLTAPSSEFDQVFESHVVNKQQNQVRFSTQGRVVGQKLGKGR